LLNLDGLVTDWTIIGTGERLGTPAAASKLALVEKKLDKPLRVSRIERLTLAITVTKLRSVTNHTMAQGDLIHVFKPDTVIGWHRALVKRKWTYQQESKRGRPRTAKNIEQLVIRLAVENKDWV
jgi:hypothetical protein